LAGSSAVTAWLKIEMPTIAATRASASPCRTTMSEAMECPTSATRGSAPGRATA
jgi:hypothetical protein